MTILLPLMSVLGIRHCLSQALKREQEARLLAMLGYGDVHVVDPVLVAEVIEPRQRHAAGEFRQHRRPRLAMQQPRAHTSTTVQDPGVDHQTEIDLIAAQVADLRGDVRVLAYASNRSGSAAGPSRT